MDEKGVTKPIRTQRLHNLRHEEEGQFDRVQLHHPHGILQDQWVVAVSWLKVDQRSDRRYGCPEWKPLRLISAELR